MWWQQAGRCDWLPGVVGLHDRSGVLVAEGQEVEEVSEVEQGVHVVLKGVMRHAWERHARLVIPQQEGVWGQEGFKVSAQRYWV